MRYATRTNDSHFIFGAQLKQKIDFFEHPYSSHNTDIFLSNGVKEKEKFYEIQEIKSKMMCLSYGKEFVFIPLLHSLDESSEILLK